MYKVIGTSILDAGGTLLRYLYTLLSSDFCFVFAFRLNTFGRKNMFINIHKMCAFECDVVSGVVGSSCELMIGQSLVADDSSSVFGGGTGILAFPNCGQQFVSGSWLIGCGKHRQAHSFRRLIYTMKMILRFKNLRSTILYYKSKSLISCQYMCFGGK